MNHRFHRNHRLSPAVLPPSVSSVASVVKNHVLLALENRNALQFMEIPLSCGSSNPPSFSMDTTNRLTERIIGAGYAVLNELKPGLDEKLYERALKIELNHQRLSVECQREFEVHYGGERIGSLIPDMIVEGQVIVDAKVVSSFHESHIAQMLGYLNITGLKTGMLLNFKHAKLGIKRISV